HDRVDAFEERLRVGDIVHDDRLSARALHRVDVRASDGHRARVRPAFELAHPPAGDRDDHHWSKFRWSSQSVTARLKCASSWRPVFNRCSCTSEPNASAATFEPANASSASWMLAGTRGSCGAAYALPSNLSPGSSSCSMPCKPAAIVAAKAR